MTAIWICLGAGIALLVVAFLIKKGRATHVDTPSESRRRTVWGTVIEWLAILF